MIIGLKTLPTADCPLPTGHCPLPTINRIYFAIIARIMSAAFSAWSEMLPMYCTSLVR